MFTLAMRIVYTPDFLPALVVAAEDFHSAWQHPSEWGQAWAGMGLDPSFVEHECRVMDAAPPLNGTGRSACSDRPG